MIAAALLEVALGVSAIACVAGACVAVRFGPDWCWSARRRWFRWRSDRALDARMRAQRRLQDLEASR